MKAHRTIRRDLEDWLHIFRSALEVRASGSEAEIRSQRTERQRSTQVGHAPEPLSGQAHNVNLTLSFAL